MDKRIKIDTGKGGLLRTFRKTIGCLPFLLLLLTARLSAQTAVASRPFEMAAIPSTLTDPMDRANYLVMHYWDHYDFGDTSQIEAPDPTEQALANFIDLMRFVPADTMVAATRSLLQKTEPERSMFFFFTEILEKYLYDIESPMRDEEMFISVLEYMLASPTLTEVEKIRPAHLLELASKNRKGTPASDFAYTLTTGEANHLYGLEGDYILLFFYDPDCPVCLRTARALANSSLIGDFLQDKRLTILALYPDEDLEAWRPHASTFPDEWMNAYDPGRVIKNEELYDLLAPPTIYLLSGDKTVLLKDTHLPQIEQYLANTSE